MPIDRMLRSKRRRSRPISRVLSRTTIHLGCVSPRTSSDLPGSLHGPCVQPRVRDSKLRASLFGLAPGGVCRATECYHRRGALLPHPFTLTGPTCVGLRRFAFCCTFRGLTPPRRYLAPCPGSPDFPPRLRAAIAWPTPPRMVETRPLTSKQKGCAGCNWRSAANASKPSDAQTRKKRYFSPRRTRQ